jgi:YesN/AraC family two-component response regulator
VRGADTDRHDFAPQAAGLEAIFSGLAYNSKDDYQLLETGILIYDGLYSWAQFLYKKKHTEAPVEQLLLQVYHQYLKSKDRTKAPVWAKELKEMIQDQIDTNISLSLQQVSEELEINPAYLSREFSKYFENLTFGNYIRKLRIEKAQHLIETSDHSLTEIAYLTGFSDQAHFSRIFKLYNGKTPTAFKKSLGQK